MKDNATLTEYFNAFRPSALFRIVFAGFLTYVLLKWFAPGVLALLFSTELIEAIYQDSSNMQRVVINSMNEQQQIEWLRDLLKSDTSMHGIYVFISFIVAGFYWGWRGIELFVSDEELEEKMEESTAMEETEKSKE